jgi:transposase-like protein
MANSNFTALSIANGGTISTSGGTFSTAILDNVWDNNYVGKYTDIAIGGKLVNVNIKLSNFDTINLTSDNIKWRIADHLVKYMIENKLIEFTKQDNPIDNSTTINARCYLAPDREVRILRQMTPNT